MHFALPSVLFLVGMASALPSQDAALTSVKRSSATTAEKVQQAAAALKGKTVEDQSETSDCVGPLLCCGSLTTPLDHIVDPILEDLGINAANIVGSIGLLCDPYESSTCSSAPQCCTEANLLGGTLALGCSALKN